MNQGTPELGITVEGIDVGDGDDSPVASAGPARGGQGDAEGDFDVPPVSVAAKPRSESTSTSVPAPAAAAATAAPVGRQELTTSKSLERPSRNPVESVVSKFARLGTEALRRLFDTTEPLPTDIRAELLKRIRPEAEQLLKAWREREDRVQPVASLLHFGLKRQREDVIRKIIENPADALTLATRLAALNAAEDPFFQRNIEMLIAKSVYEFTPHVHRLRERLEEVYEELRSHGEAVDTIGSNLAGSPGGSARARIDALVLPIIETVRREEDPSGGGTRRPGSAEPPTYSLRLAKEAVGLAAAQN